MQEHLKNYDFCYDAFCYELNNHEFCITYDYTDTLSSLNLTYDELTDRQKEILEKAAKVAANEE